MMKMYSASHEKCTSKTIATLLLIKQNCIKTGLAKTFKKIQQKTL